MGKSTSENWKWDCGKRAREFVSDTPSPLLVCVITPQFTLVHSHRRMAKFTQSNKISGVKTATSDWFESYQGTFLIMWQPDSYTVLLLFCCTNMKVKTWPGENRCYFHTKPVKKSQVPVRLSRRQAEVERRVWIVFCPLGVSSHSHSHQLLGKFSVCAWKTCKGWSKFKILTNTGNVTTSRFIIALSKSLITYNLWVFVWFLMHTWWNLYFDISISSCVPVFLLLSQLHPGILNISEQ